MSEATLRATYILPIRRHGAEGFSELTRYLEWLNQRVELIVVDGSTSEDFGRHHIEWRDLQHIRPASEFECANGKVWGVLTGLARASNDRVVIADDDVRYNAASLARLVGLLDRYEVVRPQNYFRPLPWHARWDTARSLINRMTGGDWPGTLAIRLSALGPSRRYDGDCLFENLELVRTIKAAGGREWIAHDVYVARLPPTARHFLSQRIRQAYDELARPRRLAFQAALLPSGLVLAKSKPGTLLLSLAAIAAFAEAGRRRAGGVRVFPLSASLIAPLWVMERAVCVWLALGARVLFGGIGYSSGRLRQAATPQRELVRRMQPLVNSMEHAQ